MADENITLDPKEIKISKFNFDQIEGSIRDIIYPDIPKYAVSSEIPDDIESVKDTTNQGKRLKDIVNSNCNYIDDLKEKVGDAQLPANQTITSVIKNVWDLYEGEAGQGAAPPSKKINELMNTVGLKSIGAEVYPFDISDAKYEDSLIYKVDTLWQTKPRGGLLMRVPYSLNCLSQAEGAFDTIDNTIKGDYATFKYMKVTPGQTYTFPKNKIHVLWYIEETTPTTNLKDPVILSAYTPPSDPKLPDLEGGKNPLTKDILQDVTELTIPEGVDRISISFNLRGDNATGTIDELIEQLFFTRKELDISENLLVNFKTNEYVTKENPVIGVKDLLSDKYKEKFILNSALNREYKEDNPDEFEYKLNYQENQFTVLNLPVQPFNTYNFNISTTPGAIRPVTIFFLGKKTSENIKVVEVKFFDENERSFYVNPEVQYVSITFDGDTGELTEGNYGIKIAPKIEDLDSVNLLYSQADLYFPKGASLSSIITTDDNNNQMIIQNSSGYQAVKGLDYGVVKYNDFISLRASNLESLKNFNTVSRGEKKDTYQIRISKSGFYLITGQLGFIPNFNFKGETRFKAAVVLKNDKDLPEISSYSSLGRYETLLTESLNIYSNVSKNKKITVGIPPKIVLLKKGDLISLKGSFDNDNKESKDYTICLSPEQHSTYLTLLKLKDLFNENTIEKQLFSIKFQPIKNESTDTFLFTISKTFYDEESQSEKTENICINEVVSEEKIISGLSPNTILHYKIQLNTSAIESVAESDYTVVGDETLKIQLKEKEKTNFNVKYSRAHESNNISSSQEEIFKKKWIEAGYGNEGLGDTGKSLYLKPNSIDDENKEHFYFFFENGLGQDSSIVPLLPSYSAESFIYEGPETPAGGLPFYSSLVVKDNAKYNSFCELIETENKKGVILKLNKIEDNSEINRTINFRYRPSGESTDASIFPGTNPINLWGSDYRVSGWPSGYFAECKITNHSDGSWSISTLDDSSVSNISSRNRNSSNSTINYKKPINFEDMVKLKVTFKEVFWGDSMTTEAYEKNKLWMTIYDGLNPLSRTELKINNLIPLDKVFKDANSNSMTRENITDKEYICDFNELFKTYPSLPKNGYIVFGSLQQGIDKCPKIEISKILLVSKQEATT